MRRARINSEVKFTVIPQSRGRRARPLPHGRGSERRPSFFQNFLSHARQQVIPETKGLQSNSRSPGQKFFELSLLSMVACGYLAVAATGYLDLPTVLLTGLAYLLRLLMVAGLVRLQVPAKAVAALTLAYIGFFPIDYQFVSRGFLEATIHLVFFLAALKIITATSSRDYFFLAIIGFLELLAAAVISTKLDFFVFLGLFLLSSVAALMSSEILRSMRKSEGVARGGLRKMEIKLGVLAVSASIAVLLLTAGLFLVLPRTAHAAFRYLVSERYHLPGFSGEVTLGQIGRIKNDSSSIFHVRLFSGASNLQAKWRGAALSNFDGRRWSTPPGHARIVRLVRGQAIVATDQQRRQGRGRIAYTVDLKAINSDTLFIAGLPEAIYLEQSTLIRTDSDTYQLGFLPAEGVRYHVFSFQELDPPLEAPAKTAISEEVRARYLQLPPLDQRIPALAREITDNLPSVLARARSLEEYLKSQYAYTTELPSHEPPDPLAFFLFERRKGHCEYFASAMTVMLRSLGIPARLVNGFQSGIYNPITKLYVIRAADAHSWVEAYVPGQEWITFDPTPPDPNPPSQGLWAKLALWVDTAQTYWQDWVLGYNLNRQLFLAGQLGQSSRNFRVRWLDSLVARAGKELKTAGAFFKEHWGAAAALALLAAAMVWFGPKTLSALRNRHRAQRARRGRASSIDATVLYGRMLKSLEARGYQKPPWSTPAEFSSSLRDSEIRPLVEQFTAAYNALRFGGRSAAAPVMASVLARLERSPR